MGVGTDGGEVFVGRAYEHELLRRFLEPPEHSQAGLVLVVGDAGVGKTAFVNAVVGSNPDLAARVRWSAGVAGDGDLALIRRALGHAPGGPLASEVLAPEALARSLGGDGGHSPIIVVDDAGSADRASLEVLASVSSHATIVLICRRADLASFTESITDLSVPPNGLVVVLGGLTPPEIVELAAITSGPITLAEAQRAFARTLGHPDQVRSALRTDSPEVTVSPACAPEVREARGAALTPAELAVSLLAAGGSTNREIADAWGVSHRTVESHLHRAYAKLSVRNRTELVHGLRRIGHEPVQPSAS